MGHSHGVDAYAGTGVRHRSKLQIVLVLSLTVFVVEAVAAWVTGSLALLADAGHMLSDSAGLAMALAAIGIAQLGGGKDSRRTFGYHRTEILAAALNGLVLIALSVWIAIHALGRLSEPADVDGALMLAAGSLGLVANVVGLLLLRQGAQESLNVRGAYLEVLGDALGSCAVIVAAISIWAWGWQWADAVASIAIAAMIIPRAISLLREVVDVLLEGTPRDVDLRELREHIVGMGGVADVHDLHVWTISSGLPVMSAHVVVDDSITEFGEAEAVLDRLRECLAEHFDVEHSTFQLEAAGHADKESHLHH